MEKAANLYPYVLSAEILSASCSLLRNQALSLSVPALVLQKLSVLYLPAKPFSLAQAVISAQRSCCCPLGRQLLSQTLSSQKKLPGTTSALEMHFDQSSWSWGQMYTCKTFIFLLFSRKTWNFRFVGYSSSNSVHFSWLYLSEKVNKVCSGLFFPCCEDLKSHPVSPAESSHLPSIKYYGHHWRKLRIVPTSLSCSRSGKDCSSSCLLC